MDALCIHTKKYGCIIDSYKNMDALLIHTKIWMHPKYKLGLLILAKKMQLNYIRILNT